MTNFKMFARGCLIKTASFFVGNIRVVPAGRYYILIQQITPQLLSAQ